MSAKRSTPAPTSPKSRSNTPKTPRRRTRAAIWAGSRVARSPISLRRTSSSPSWLVRLASSTAGLRRRPGTRSSRSPTRATSTTIRRRPLRITRTSTGSTSRRRLTTSSASSPASSSSSTAALAAVLGRWPLGIDVVPASRLDRHAFSTLRAVAIALDGPIDWALLRARYPSAHPVTLFEPDRTTTLAEAEPQAAGSRFLVLAPLDPFADLASLDTVMRIAEKLRAPDGCPWDREQTHASLRPHLLEEAYETLAALDSGDPDRLRDELGDLLFQIAIHAQLAREEGTFDANEVARRLNEKLIGRHPHVFKGTEIAGGDLLAQWERIKREEQDGGARGLLGGVPRELPALFAAERMLERAARVKIEPPRLELPLDIDDQDFLGELLFDVVAAARDSGFDAETALREANERFAAHVGRVEARAAKDGRALESYAPDEMRSVWDETA